jgi:hypothetical protein
MKKTVLRHSAAVGIACLLFVGFSGVARASDHPDRERNKDRGNYIFPDLAADGVTSDDVALAKAAAACEAAGTRLVLPAGKILLTGTATIVLNRCAMVGAGAPAGNRTGDYGTTILLTSETVPPFNSAPAG